MTDGQTGHAKVTPVTIGQIAIAVPPNNGHNCRDIQTEMLKQPISNTRFSFNAHVQRNPREYPHKHILPETRLSTEHFCC